MSVPPESPSADLIAAYHRLYEVVWNETGTVEISEPGYNGLSYDDTAKIDDAAGVIAALLYPDAKSNSQPG